MINSAPVCTVWLRKRIVQCRRPHAHGRNVSRSTERYTVTLPIQWIFQGQVNAKRRLKINPETVQVCLLSLQSVLLYCLSVLLSAGMLRQYFVCFSHAVWVVQCCSAPATCQPKPHIPPATPWTYHFSLTVTPQPSFLHSQPAISSLSVKSLETVINVITKPALVSTF